MSDATAPRSKDRSAESLMDVMNSVLQKRIKSVARSVQHRYTKRINELENENQHLKSVIDFYRKCCYIQPQYIENQLDRHQSTEKPRTSSVAVNPGICYQQSETQPETHKVKVNIISMEEKTGPQAIQSAPKPVNLAVLTAKSPAVITAKNPTVLTVKSPAVITAAHSASSEVMEGLEVLISVEKDTINDYEDFNDDTAHAFDIIDPRYEILKKIKTIISPIIIINTINDISKLYKESKKFISKRWISSYRKELRI